MTALDPNKCCVVITGMGAITALGQGIVVLKEGLKQGKKPFSQDLQFPSVSFPVITAAIKDFNFEQALTSIAASDELKLKILKVGRRAPKVIQTSLIAALEAYQSAQIAERQIDPMRMGLVIAGQNITQRYCYDLQQSFQQEPDYLSPAYAIQFMDTNHVGTLSEAFGIQGEGFTVGGASASGNVAIIQACRLLRQGSMDVCLVVGAMADLSPLEIQGFHSCGALGGRHFASEPLKASRPFDQAREGFIWGQGSGCLILEASECADRDGLTPIGEIKGTAMTLDAHRHPDPSMQGESRVMRQALANAGLQPKEISYINTHGSSSVLGDATELQAIREVFANSLDRLWLNASKGLLGHCLWSAGVLEAIVTLIQMQEGFIHPNANLENPIDTTMCWAGKTMEAADISCALNNSFGFGGINTSVILAKGEK